MLGCSNWSLILKRKEMPEQNYPVATVPLPTPGDHWADGKLLGDALNSCAGGTQGPLVNAHWLLCLWAGTEPTTALAQRHTVAGRLEFCQALPNTRRRVGPPSVLFLVAFRPFNVDHHVSEDNPTLSGVGVQCFRHSSIPPKWIRRHSWHSTARHFYVNPSVSLS